MKRIPLHYQIFIALVLGTIIGLIANPGEVPLDNEQVKLDFSVRPAGTDDRLTVTVQDPRELESYEKSLPNLEALEKSFPRLADEFRANAAAGKAGEQMPAVSITRTVDVTRRRVHIVEDGKKIEIVYTRQHDGKPVSSNIRVDDTQELAGQHPLWRELYDKHGGGWPAKVSIWSKFIGDLFLRLLKMITIPLIVFSLVTGVAGLGDTSSFGSMFSKTLLYYLCTSMLAIATGILMVNLIRPGVNADLPGGGEAIVIGGEQSLGGVFVGLVNNMIPENPIQSLAGAEFLSIITFSILIGIFIIHTGGQSAATLRNFFQAGFDVMMGMTMFIIALAPIGVFAFMVFATASQGLGIFLTLAWYMVTVFLALLVHAAIVLPAIVWFVGKRSPWKFAQAMSPALMTAFSTASSNGTLPLTISSVEQRAGVSNRVSSFVLPLGATINMDGTALYEAVAVLFISQAYTGMVMPVHQQVLVAITALLASVGAAGIPHAGLVMMAIVLQAVGLPLEAQGVIIAVDRVLDMCRTSVNVWSDSCGCAVVSRFQPADVTGTVAAAEASP